MDRKEDRDLNEVFSDVGFAFELLKVFFYAIIKKGGSGKDLKRLLRDKNLADQIADLIVSAKKVAADTFRVMCDYTTPSYKELESAFDWVNDWYERVEFKAIDICKSVSREPRELEFVYVHMDRSASTEEVLAKMEKRNLRPALYEEGLAFAKSHPDEQRKFLIVILGSVCLNSDGDRCVAPLAEGSVGRSLNLYVVEGDWCGRYRFLAVSK